MKKIHVWCLVETLASISENKHFTLLLWNFTLVTDLPPSQNQPDFTCKLKHKQKVFPIDIAAYWTAQIMKVIVCM